MCKEISDLENEVSNLILKLRKFYLDKDYIIDRSRYINDNGIMLYKLEFYYPELDEESEVK